MKYTVEDIINVIEKEDLMIEVDLRQLNPNEKLTVQGVDSLDVASLLFGIEDYYNIKIDNESIGNGEWRTINSILENMERLIP